METVVCSQSVAILEYTGTYENQDDNASRQ